MVVSHDKEITERRKKIKRNKSKLRVVVFLRSPLFSPNPGF